MDMGTLRGIITGLLLIGFIGLVCWAYSKRRKPDFDEAANLPFADEDEPSSPDTGAGQARARQEQGDRDT
ncbi:CcoQ/FixQ family Cbb3-type cytochrome c oxidase assembly chaperone [Halomonas smyrnensis]|uniref:CcoQ/FixQ family Cbb3-type cytochrome c oxidase assembly chaperone n=1 Tax=Halomonas smyrnensis TaxID=720605 RepID=UPI0002DDBB8D|nr:CcoQ/FixQ family Cbb3-type cytochrome c oxidase assembly chaperone [Halomonas smyrnensis]